MAEKNKNNKDSQMGQVTPKKYLEKKLLFLYIKSLLDLHIKRQNQREK
jgi:hypothetical protein